MNKNEKKADKESPTTDEKVHAGKYGILGAFVAVTCCIGPLVPILLGVGSATALFGLDRYKPWFIGLGLLILGLASWYAVRKQNRCCAEKSVARNARMVATIFGIGIGTYLLLQYVAVPALSSVASSKIAASQGSANQSAERSRNAESQEVTLIVEGMTCAGCSVGVEAAFLEVPGVLSAKVDWKTGKATVRIDPKTAQAEDLLNADVEDQYSLRLTDETE